MTNPLFSILDIDISIIQLYESILVESSNVQDTDSTYVLPKSIDSDRFMATIKKLGFNKVRNSPGSHTMYSDGTRQVSIVIKGHKEQWHVSVLNRYLIQGSISREEFFTCYENL